MNLDELERLLVTYENARAAQQKTTSLEALNRAIESMTTLDAALRNAARELIADARQAREYRSALLEVRSHLHASGRRPETCYEMGVIDAAIAQEQK